MKKNILKFQQEQNETINVAGPKYFLKLIYFLFIII